ncbi:MAG: hypothetical protein RLZZ512_1464, partial [Bacteroidota bacterium]
MGELPWRLKRFRILFISQRVSY